MDFDWVIFFRFHHFLHNGPIDFHFLFQKLHPHFIKFINEAITVYNGMKFAIILKYEFENSVKDEVYSHHLRSQTRCILHYDNVETSYNKAAKDKQNFLDAQ